MKTKVEKTGALSELHRFTGNLLGYCRDSLQVCFPTLFSPCDFL